MRPNTCHFDYWLLTNGLTGILEKWLNFSGGYGPKFWRPRGSIHSSRIFLTHARLRFVMFDIYHPFHNWDAFAGSLLRLPRIGEVATEGQQKGQLCDEHQFGEQRPVNPS
jgi:hypothetical protein